LIGDKGDFIFFIEYSSAEIRLGDKRSIAEQGGSLGHRDDQFDVAHVARLTVDLIISGASQMRQAEHHACSDGEGCYPSNNARKELLAGPGVSGARLTCWAWAASKRFAFG